MKCELEIALSELTKTDKETRKLLTESKKKLYEEYDNERRNKAKKYKRKSHSGRWV